MKVSYVMFDITNRCNFKCNHCYKGNSSNSIDLHNSSIIGFLKSIDNCGQTANVILSGGEPLLFASLYELLDYICDGRKVRINTNAFLLDKHIDKLLKYENLELQISLDGYDDESFYHIRNNHFFAKILQNACLAKQKGLKLYFRTTLTKRTIKHYKCFIELSKKIGIPLILRPMVYTGEEKQKALAIDFETLLNWHKDCIKNGLSDYAGEYIVSPHCPLLNEEQVFSTLTVDVFGDVYPCMLLKSNLFLMGNIYKNSYDYILSNSDEVKNKLLVVLNDSKCQHCDFRKQFGDGTCLISCFLKKELCIKQFLNNN